MTTTYEDDRKNDKPPVAGLIKCKDPTGCNVCGRTTIWRGLLIDIHICSPECFEEARELLNISHNNKD